MSTTSEDVAVPPIASPKSTGGAGTLFEQHVGAYWLTQLLVGARPPILHDCVVVGVKFQASSNDYATDDFLVTGQSAAGPRRLLCQSKRTFTVSAKDAECQKTILDLWADFNASARFSRSRDAFALITLRGTNALLGDFGSLLDAARETRDDREFAQRLSKPGLISKKAHHYHTEIETILASVSPGPPSAVDIWSFLRAIHILSLDLTTDTAQHEAHLKSLLALTTTEPDPVASADATWNELLRISGDSAARTQVVSLEHLPQELRRRHSRTVAPGTEALQALAAHSKAIFNGIRTTIGPSLTLERQDLVQEVFEHLRSSQLVLITGGAGSGKSVIAKEVASASSASAFVFAFRADEFAKAHLDEVLHSAQIPATSATLSAILAPQDRKMLLVESVERLLEKPIRDAFSDLLGLLRTDRSWQVIMTCRDYSATLVRDSLLSATGIEHSMVTIGPLDDAALEKVARTVTALAAPLGNSRLRPLLRNPYILDKALKVNWDASALPRNERELRDLIWRDMVRAEARSPWGLARRREQSLIDISLRRARSLSQYAPCDDIDPSVLEVLERDSLIIYSGESRVRAAPAHDVLEDWALLRWIGERHEVRGANVRALADDVGPHPAVRRTYRQWVAELVEYNELAADDLFRLVSEDGPPAYFSDDTIISVLRSKAAARFLETHHAKLFANRRALLRRVVHLLRVACVTPGPWFLGTDLAIHFSVPEGAAWAAVLRLVASDLAAFDQRDTGLLLGLVNDWAKGISLATAYPEGSSDVAQIGHWLIPYFDDYRTEKQLTQTLQVLSKVPLADQERFSRLLRGLNSEGNRDRVSEEMRKLIFERMDGSSAARDLPALVTDVGRSYLLLSKEEDRGRGRWGASLDLEPRFGLSDRLGHRFFPPSAFRGPWLSLLRHHSKDALAFLLDVLNQSAEGYAHPRGYMGGLEPAVELTLTFADGSTKAQWHNQRLWQLHRGTSVGPYVLQCILMALESWLLQVGSEQPAVLDTTLLGLLHRTSSGAVTGVVASVATAHPAAAGETLLALLSCPQCIYLDRGRLQHDQGASVANLDIMPDNDAFDRIFNDERKKSAAQAHRQHDLEIAVLLLQMGPFRTRVQAQLDHYQAVLPPIAEQNERDRIWRLALHRMDLRNRRALASSEKKSAHDGSRETPSQTIELALTAPDRDLREMTERSMTELNSHNQSLGLFMWGTSVFQQKREDYYDPGAWRGTLAEARAMHVDINPEVFSIGVAGPGLIAAVCARDHGLEMPEEDRAWCVETICSEIEQGADDWSHLARIQMGSMSASGRCASVLPCLLNLPMTDALKSRVRVAFALSQTHPNDEVRAYAATGARQFLWAADHDLALLTVRILANEATDADHQESVQPFPVGGNPGAADPVEVEAAQNARRYFAAPGELPPNVWEGFDASSRRGAAAYGRLLNILGGAPGEVFAIEAYKRLAGLLVVWWDEDDDRHRSSGGAEREHSYNTEAELRRLLERFALIAPQVAIDEILRPLYDAAGSHPKEVGRFLKGIIIAEDQDPRTEQFWSIWSAFAERVRGASWLSQVDDQYSSGREMISAIFLGPWWKEDAQHWRSLDGHVDRVHALFEALPSSRAAFANYTRFLYCIGRRSLPAAFTRLARCLRQNGQVLQNENTVFMLETLLRRFVYSRPQELKRREELRDAVLSILDALVDCGSSAAFRMRDDFVTPGVESAQVERTASPTNVSS